MGPLAYPCENCGALPWSVCTGLLCCPDRGGVPSEPHRLGRYRPLPPKDLERLTQTLTDLSITLERLPVKSSKRRDRAAELLRRAHLRAAIWELRALGRGRCGGEWSVLRDQRLKLEGLTFQVSHVYS